MALSSQSLAGKCERVGHSQDEGLLFSLPLHPSLLCLNSAITHPSVDLQTIHPLCAPSLLPCSQKAPLPRSYALAIGPNEGKEGSKAFWSEPLQKGDEKAAEPCSASTSNPTWSSGGSKEGAESQGTTWPTEGSRHAPGLLRKCSTHPAETFIVKGFGEEQPQQLQLALADTATPSGWGDATRSQSLTAEPSTG